MTSIIYIIIIIIISIQILLFSIPNEVIVLPEIIEEEIIVLHKELVPICGCESMGDPYEDPQQFKEDGTPVVNRNKDGSIDWGMCQINDKIWDDIAIKKGFDYKNTEIGNIQMANLIHANNGLTPWRPSKRCWINAMPRY